MTYRDQIAAAIKALGGRGGSSRQAIKKHLEANGTAVNAAAFRTALAAGVKSGDFAQSGQSFSLTEASKTKMAASAKSARKIAPKAALKGSGFYVTIDGKKYDREMVEAANAATAGKHDTLISIEDAKKILSAALDGGKYTATEKATMHYIRDNYKFTEKADEYVRHEVAAFAAKHAAKPSKKKAATKKKKASTKKAAAKAPAKGTSYLSFAVAAVRGSKDRKGTSRQAIKKYVSANCLKSGQTLNTPALRKALRKAVDSGALTMEGQRFRAPAVEKAAPKKKATKKKDAPKKKKATKKKKASKKKTSKK